MDKGSLKRYPVFLFELISSARFAVLITTLIIFFLLFGLFIPQRPFMTFKEYEAWKRSSPRSVEVLEALGLLHVYSHPFLTILFVLLLLSVLACTLKRLPEVRGRISSRKSSFLNGPQTLRMEIPHISERVLERLRDYLRKKGFRLSDAEDGFMAVKNPYSCLGSILFHVSFLLIMTGAIISMRTRFTGTLILSEGQPFSGRMEQFYGASGVLTGDELSHLRLLLEKVSPSFDEAGNVIALSAQIRVLGKGKARVIEARVNRPAHSGPYEIHLKGFGYCPLWILMDAEGRELDGAYVNLVVGGDREDSFFIPDPRSKGGEGYRVSVLFYPDFVDVDGHPSTRSFYPKNPYFYLRIIKDDRLRYQGMVPVGERISFDGFQLEFREVRYWVRLGIVKDSGKGIIFFSFLLGICGLAWRLLFYRKELLVIVNGEKARDIILLGSSDLYTALFKREIEEFLNFIKEP